MFWSFTIQFFFHFFPSFTASHLVVHQLAPDQHCSSGNTFPTWPECVCHRYIYAELWCGVESVRRNMLFPPPAKILSTGYYTLKILCKKKVRRLHFKILEVSGNMYNWWLDSPNNWWTCQRKRDVALLWECPVGEWGKQSSCRNILGSALQSLGQLWQ